MRRRTGRYYCPRMVQAPGKHPAGSTTHPTEPLESPGGKDSDLDCRLSRAGTTNARVDKLVKGRAVAQVRRVLRRPDPERVVRAVAGLLRIVLRDSWLLTSCRWWVEIARNTHPGHDLLPVYYLLRGRAKHSPRTAR